MFSEKVCLRLLIALFVLITSIACGKGAQESADLNSGPVPSILEPASNTTHLSESSITFRGKGSDTEDGELSDNALVWASDIDGVIGSGAQVMQTLSAGNHLISLTATDADGAKATSYISLTIVDPTSVGSLSNKMSGFNFINNGAAQADSYTVFLNLNASSNRSVNAYFVAESIENGSIPSKPGADQAGWMELNKTVTLNRTEAYTLSQNYDYGSNIKLYVWFKDEEGNISGEAVDGIQITVAAQGIPYQQSFETGLDDWTKEGELWEAGPPVPQFGLTVTPLDGSQVAALLLSGQYAAEQQGRLISPVFVLPVINNDEQIYFSYAEQVFLGQSDLAQAEISFETAPGEWSQWRAMNVSRYAPAWSPIALNLSEYQGQKIRLSFTLANLSENSGFGWFIDDIQIHKQKNIIVESDVAYIEDFESGPGVWSADYGMAWEIGSPNNFGPAQAFSGSQLAGTRLAGQISGVYTSRLTSPVFELPDLLSGEEITLRYATFYQLKDESKAHVQISEFSETEGWSAWQNISAQIHHHTSDAWAHPSEDLTRFAGKRIRLGFTFDNNSATAADGWYIDDVRIAVTQSVAITAETPYINGFENGWQGWSEGEGIWEIGVPNIGIREAYAGSNLVGTTIETNTPDREARLVSPTFHLPMLETDQEIILKFQYWMLYLGVTYIEISEQLDSGHWDEWAKVSGAVWGGNGGWVQPRVDLTAYAGKSVRLSFYKDTYYSQANSGVTGFFVDNFEIAVEDVLLVDSNMQDDFSNGLGNWWRTQSIWEAGLPGLKAPVPIQGFTHSGLVGTYLNGNNFYIQYLYSRSMRIANIPGAYFSFWHWYQLGDGSAVLQISVFNDDGTGWSGWQNFSETFTGESDLTAAFDGWALKNISLENYLGQKVRFRFKAQAGPTVAGWGWYLDNVGVAW
ncbi:MAG: immune inhibitor A [Gammaproteobacteria bacterium]|nr:immune inhibitor A [Gammaproteobacteria bacterium]